MEVYIMSTIICKCGNTMSNTLAPNDIQLRVYTDKEWDDIIAMDRIEDTLDIPFPKYDVWRCPKCERIYVFDSDNMLKNVYALDNDWKKPE